MQLARHHIKEILESQALAPSKKLGQNFLTNNQICKEIVELAGLGAEETVVELGVGLGSLTHPLAQKVGRVIGLELDSGLVEYHRQKNDLPANVTLIHEDLLKSDFRALAQECGGRLTIVANLPYSISNPLLFKLIAHAEVMEFAVLMLQKEVADRLSAGVGTKEYGIISVILATCATVQTLLHVDPAQFHPRPKVDSVVVKITFHPRPSRAALLPDHDPALLRALVKGAFGQRRKTLINALAAAPALGLEKPALLPLLAAAGIAPEIRAERLTVEDFVRLCRLLPPLGN